MCFQPLVCILVLEVDTKEQGSAGEGDGIGQLADDVVELHAGGGGAGAAERRLTLAEPENWVRFPEGGNVHL